MFALDFLEKFLLEYKMDLEISNYTFDDILRLFNLNQDFDENCLKRAKKKVAKSHPDKSGLSPEIFRFYVKAYSTLLQIWEFKRNHKNENTEYDAKEIHTNRKIELARHFREDGNKAIFHEWFNAEFEKRHEHKDDGHGTWFQSGEDIQEIKQNGNNWNEINRCMDERKENLRQIVLREDIRDSSLGFGGCSMLDETKNVNVSDIFSSLQFEDLRKAHTETVIPVTNEDYENVKKFATVNELNNYRNNPLQFEALSESESRIYLEKQRECDNKTATLLAYQLHKERENYAKKENSFFKGMRLLGNQP